jgi:hybrid polyketide synthase/nonribosomal peptide synthetase ACE1
MVRERLILHKTYVVDQLTLRTGTGTQAGDPVEAEAIQSAFFPSDDIKRDPLLVGSIKTVIGHAESTSGLAGLIKASLALQNSIVPPNLLFSELNPKLKPYYKDLRIPTSPATWPLVASDRPRRASVNR